MLTNLPAGALSHTVSSEIDISSHQRLTTLQLHLSAAAACATLSSQNWGGGGGGEEGRREGHVHLYMYLGIHK